MVNIIRAADLALVGSNGGAWVAPLGTAQPADPSEAPSGPWLAIGAISEDGLMHDVLAICQRLSRRNLNNTFYSVPITSVRTFFLTAWETNQPIVRSLQYKSDISDLIPD